ncbi:tRNA synthetases class I (C) catalytic domain-containing protein [Zopfochytrium polystomum]|nr:tRNA synthetases class I (C) catalytic domain-containing protein [Zopfochytrium polystomum]
MSAAATAKLAQPEWHKPVDSMPRLVVNNTMTHTKTEFIPARGKHVGWYTCGPTVYDSSHLGHARTYISFDIIRRIMEDYFGYDVTYVMNITDIDDKIIIAARRKHLFDAKKNASQSLTPELIADVQKGLNVFLQSSFGEWLDGEKNGPNARATLIAALGKGTKDQKFAAWLQEETAKEPKTDMRMKAAVSFNWEAAKDTYGTYLDSQLKESVTDPAIFRDFAAYWEAEYFKDMDALNVRRPDILTRVSEYVPEIIEFVKTIIKNGFAYESEGSVYFNTAKFDKDPAHFYAKLEPHSASNLKLLQEGEGDLEAGTGEKVNKSDFVLWKKSKPGEPSWESPWGLGRPGWHIECSAMAGDVIGEKLDIHAGGIDLAFPHHDNEIAQSEGHYNCKQWVNYFLHTGHLHIENQKMSKSLKNFLTIQQILEKHTPSQIRILFLLNSWDSIIDFKDSSFQEARVFETTINNFLINAKSLVQEARASPAVFTGRHQFHQQEKNLLRTFEQKQGEIHAAFCDNFDTFTAMNALRDMITASNSYIQAATTARAGVSSELILKIAKYVTKTMRLLGVFRDDGVTEIGEGAKAGSGAAASSVEEVADPYVRLLARFRDRVRELSRAGAPPAEFLAACDRLRDVDLVMLNVSLDDRDDGRALVKFVDKEVILRQQAEKRAAQEAAAAEKEARRRAEQAKEAERQARNRIRPEDMFRDEEGQRLYSKWDAKGIPTHDAQGEELSKKKSKNLQKEWDAQSKRYEKYQAESSKSG